MTKQERRGLSYLTAPERPRGKASVYVVRISYTSQAGERLCCDSDPMSKQAADKLVSDMHNADCWRAPEVRPEGYFCPTRHVTLAHQMQRQEEAREWRAAHRAETDGAVT